MKKYLLMIAAIFTMALTSAVITACGSDDEDDPVKPTLNQYRFSIEMREKEPGQLDDLKAIYPDLALTYKLPGKPAVTVPVGKDIIEAESETTESGRIELKFTGTLDESKVDEAKKYYFVPVLKYYIHQDGYNNASGNTFGLDGITGKALKEQFSKLEYPYNVSLIKPKE